MAILNFVQWFSTSKPSDESWPGEASADDCEGALQENHRNIIAWYWLILPVRTSYQLLGIHNFNQPSSSEWIHKETCVFLTVYVSWNCFLFLLSLFLTDFSWKKGLFSHVLTWWACANGKRPITSTHHFILEQSICVCVCVFRMCARARCQHVFSLVCVSFRTQGSAVSSRCFVSFYSVLSDSILSWLCVEQDQIAVPPIPSPPQPTGNRQAWLPCPQAAGPVMRSEKGFGQDVWMCVLVFLIASYCFLLLLIVSYVYLLLPHVQCSDVTRSQESHIPT